MMIEPHPIPKIAVFMNKTKTWGGQPTKESAFYMREVENVCNQVSRTSGIEARFMRSWVRDRVGIKRAITGGGVPTELITDFEKLWTESVEFMG